MKIIIRGHSFTLELEDTLSKNTEKKTSDTVSDTVKSVIIPKKIEEKKPRKKTKNKLEDDIKKDVIHRKRELHLRDFEQVARNFCEGKDDSNVKGTSFVCQLCKKRCLVKAPVNVKEENDLWFFFLGILERICKEEYANNPKKKQ